MTLDFTSREEQVLELIVEGLTNAAIAGRLEMTEQRVKNHLTVIFHKAGVRNRLELAVSRLNSRTQLASARQHMT
jgi:DNA-binding NarL/FixJ family response regulator